MIKICSYFIKLFIELFNSTDEPLFVIYLVVQKIMTHKEDI